VSPIKDGDSRRRYQREWVARRRAEFFAGKRCVDCGATEDLQLSAREPDTIVRSAIWSWSKTRREALLARCEVCCGECQRRKLSEKRAQHGTRRRYEKGCRCEQCKAAKARRNRAYAGRHGDELAAKRQERSGVLSNRVTKRCARCGRVGVQGYLPAQDSDGAATVICSNAAACRNRQLAQASRRRDTQ